MNEVLAMRRRSGMTQAALAAASGVPQPNIAAYETGRRRPSATALERIRTAATPLPSRALVEHRDEVVALVRRHKASHPRVFGSVARGEDRYGSDLDLVVTFSPGATLFDQAELQDDLRDLLGVEVDVVCEGGLRPAMRRVLDDARPL